jgi:nucleoside-diphosphate-sugar epimerase
MKLYENKDIDVVRGLYYGTTHPSTTPEGKIQYVAGNVLNYEDCVELTKGMDALVHIVGVIHPKKVKEFYQINVRGTDNIVRAAIDNGVKTIVHISSNGAYGACDYTMNEFTERDPYMSYGKSKALGEDIVTEKCMVSDTNGVILIPTWFYGIGQPDRQTKLFKMIAKGKPMIFGSGDNLRSMTNIENLADAIICSLYYRSATVDRFWIADEQPHTTNEIYETIYKVLKDKGLTTGKYKPRHIPALACKLGRIGDKILQKFGRYNQYVHVLGEMDQNIACDITLAKKELGWTPKISFEQGMIDSVEWCVGNGKWYK